MWKFSSVLVIAVLGAMAPAGADADAGQPAHGGQQRQAVQKPQAQKPRVAATQGTQPSAKYYDINLKPPSADQANKPKPGTGTYSKTLTFTLSTTTPAPPTPPSQLRAAQAPKGGNDVAVEGITLTHEGFDVQAGDKPNVAWVSGKGGARGATAGKPKAAAAPIRTTD